MMGATNDKQPCRKKWAIAVVAALAALLNVSLAPGPAAQVAPFDRHALLSDRAFFDVDAVDAADIEAFLQWTPHGRPSVLRRVRSMDGRSAAELIVDEAKRAGINPIVLLAKLQVEQSLMSRKRASRRAIDFALGCACPQGKACRSRFRGFGKQVRCAAQKLAVYAAQLRTRGFSRSLWRVGSARPAACGAVVAPHNVATASLYTYTPYVLAGRGGNWLFHKIFRRYAQYLGYYPEAPGH